MEHGSHTRRRAPADVNAKAHRTTDIRKTRALSQYPQERSPEGWGAVWTRNREGVRTHEPESPKSSRIHLGFWPHPRSAQTKTATYELEEKAIRTT